MLSQHLLSKHPIQNIFSVEQNMVVKPAQKNQSMNAFILKVLSCVGIIPTTKFQMHVVNVIMAIFVSLAIASIFVRNFLPGLYFNSEATL